MTLQEMMVMFRQYAQQMGMQNVRAILPEQICLLLNNSISDIINQTIAQNIGSTNDRVISDNSKLNQVNAFKSLYKVKNIDIKNICIASRLKSKYICSFNILIDHIDYRGIYNETIVGDESLFDKLEYLYIVDLSLNFQGVDANQGFITNYFPIRIIDDRFISDVINDYILKPTFRSPVASIHDNIIELYIDKAVSEVSGSNRVLFSSNKLIPNNLRFAYISKPAVLEFNADVGGNDVNCDLPEYMHVDIVKHAVELYQIALSGSLAATQQSQRNQQREDLRNNYRDEGNGNQVQQQ